MKNLVDLLNTCREERDKSYDLEQYEMLVANGME